SGVVRTLRIWRTSWRVTLRVPCMQATSAPLSDSWSSWWIYWTHSCRSSNLMIKTRRDGAST
ncbi:hypothetical protein M9458_003223, partial [Cirrhinus mrigala]